MVIPDKDIENAGLVDRLVDMAQDEPILLYRDGWGRLLRLGRSEGSHILRTENWVSRDQAVLVRGQKNRWEVAHVGGASNPTRVNGVRAPNSPESITLELGSILRIGWTVFIATNAEREAAGQWVIAASNEREFYRCALLVYGSFLQAADGIGVPETTFRDRLKRWAEQGDREAQDALILAEQQRRRKGKRRRTHALPIATMAIRMETARLPEDM